MKFIKLSLLLVLVATFSSCSIIKKIPAPKYNAYTDSLSSVLFSNTHNFLELMKTDNDKSYAKWEPSWDNSVKLTHILLSFDSSRKHASTITDMTNDWLKYIQKQQSIHKVKGNLNNSQILTAQDNLDLLGSTIVNTEKNVKK